MGAEVDHEQVAHRVHSYYAGGRQTEAAELAAREVFGAPDAQHANRIN
jgi:hypothetical protein